VLLQLSQSRLEEKSPDEEEEGRHKGLVLCLNMVERRIEVLLACVEKKNCEMV